MDIASLLSIGAKVLIVVALLMILGSFVDISPLLASVGVLGLALSLGAQTVIKDLIAGKLHIIPNGEVRIVSSLSKEWARATGDIGATYEEYVDDALTVLEGVADAFSADPDFESKLLESPRVLGPLTLGTGRSRCG